MTEYERLSEYIKSISNLSTDEMAEFLQAFELMKVKKRQFIVQPGFTANYRNFVIEGAFRSYVIDKDDNEHTVSFAVENWWITDFNSYVFQQPATIFVAAFQDSVILRLNYAKERSLRKQNLKFESIFASIAERALAHTQRRIISNLTLSAEERYNEYLQNYPHITQRVPQYALASYLGITTQFLSKIRNKASKS